MNFTLVAITDAVLDYMKNRLMNTSFLFKIFLNRFVILGIF